STPVVGVASSELTPAQLRARIRKSIKDAGKVEDADALRTLIDAVTYVSGDYNDPAVFGRLKEALGKAQRPVHYLAIPPSLFATVITARTTSGLSTGARVHLENPFRRDLASTHHLNRSACSVFPKEAIYRIHHFQRKEALKNYQHFRLDNAFLSPI